MATTEELTEDDLLYLIISFLEEQTLYDTADLVKMESGKFLSVEALETKLLEHKYVEADNYVSSFLIETYPESSLAIVFYRLHKLQFLSTINEPNGLPMEAVEAELMNLDVFADEEWKQKEKTDLIRLDASRNEEEIRKAVALVFKLVKNQIQQSPTLQGRYKFLHLQDLSLRLLISQRNSNQDQPLRRNQLEETSTSSHETEGQASASRTTFQANPVTENLPEGTSLLKQLQLCPPPPARIPFHPVGTSAGSAEQRSRNTWLLNSIKHPSQLHLVKLSSNERINEVDGKEQRSRIEITFPEDLTDDDLLYLIQKFLHDINLVKSAELLKKESKKFFSMDVMEEKIKNEKWGEAEDYLSSFTQPTDPVSSTDIIVYGLDKLQFLATKNKPDILDRLSVDWLQNELSLVDVPDDDKDREIEDLIGLDACSNVEQIEGAMDTLMTRIKRIIQNNPSIQGKYKFQHLQDLSLQQLIYRRNFNQNQQPGRFEGTSSKASVEQASASRDPKTGNLHEATSSHESKAHVPTSSSNSSKKRIVRLTYLNSNAGILGLLSNGYHRFWKAPLWESDTNSSAEIMMNELPYDSTEAVSSCFALSKDDSCLVSSSGGRISVFNPITLERKTRFRPSSLAKATSLAFLPECNDMVAIGKNNSTMEIRRVSTRIVQFEGDFRGHKKRVTGLAFSKLLNLLVSSSEDAQIVKWRRNGQKWEFKQASTLSIPWNNRDEALSRTEVQFHPNQTHVLVVHRTQLAIYSAERRLVCTAKWLAGEFAPIHSATFSCDGLLVYCSLLDGTLRIFYNFGRDLKLMCRIYPSAYIQSFSSSEQRQYSNEIAAHPRDPNEFAVGVTDEVYLFRPLPSIGKWGDPQQELAEGTSLVQ